MKKVVVFLVCVVIVLVGYIALDKSDIESSFGAETACDSCKLRARGFEAAGIKDPVS